MTLCSRKVGTKSSQRSRIVVRPVGHPHCVRYMYIYMCVCVCASSLYAKTSDFARLRFSPSRTPTSRSPQNGYVSADDGHCYPTANMACGLHEQRALLLAWLVCIRNRDWSRMQGIDKTEMWRVESTRYLIVKAALNRYNRSLGAWCLVLVTGILFFVSFLNL